MHIPNTPFGIDVESGDDHTLYIDVDNGIHVVIHLLVSGLEVEMYPTSGTKEQDKHAPTATMSVIWGL
jgi:hypothetical protein